jgi:uncharacterized membrane protein
MDIRLVEHTEIDRPAAEIWAVVADYGRDPQWRRGVVSMTPTPPGPVGVGTTTAEQMRLAGRTLRNLGEVTDVEADRFAWRTTDGAAAHGSRTVVALAPTRSRVELELVVTPKPSERAIAPLVGRLLRRNLRGDLQRLRALLDAEAQAALPSATGARRRS